MMRMVMHPNHVRREAAFHAGFVLAFIALACAIILMLSGCAGLSREQIVGKAVAVGGDALTCAPTEYQDVQDAIAHGGSSWIAVALQGFQCIVQVVRDLEAKNAIAMLYDPMSLMIADASDEVAPPADTRLSRGARRRLAVAKVLGSLVTTSVKK